MWILVYLLRFIVSAAHGQATNLNVFVLFNVTGIDRSVTTWNFTESIYTSFTHTLCQDDIVLYEMNYNTSVVDVHVVMRYDNSTSSNDVSAKYFECSTTNSRFNCTPSMSSCTPKLTLRCPSTMQSYTSSCLSLCFFNKIAVTAQYLNSFTTTPFCDNSSFIQQSTTTSSTTFSTTSSTTPSFVTDSSSLAAVKDEVSSSWTFYANLSLLLAIIALNLFITGFIVLKKMKLPLRRQSHFATSALVSRAFEKDSATTTKLTPPAASKESTKEKDRHDASGTISSERNLKKMASSVARPLEHQESVYNNHPISLKYSMGQPIKPKTTAAAEVYDEMEKNASENLYEQFQNQ